MLLRSLSSDAKQKVVEQLTPPVQTAPHQREQYLYALDCAEPVVSACHYDALDGFSATLKGGKNWKKPADPRQAAALAKPKARPRRVALNTDALLKLVADRFDDK